MYSCQSRFVSGVFEVYVHPQWTFYSLGCFLSEILKAEVSFWICMKESASMECQCARKNLNSVWYAYQFALFQVPSASYIFVITPWLHKSFCPMYNPCESQIELSDTSLVFARAQDWCFVCFNECCPSILRQHSEDLKTRHAWMWWRDKWLDEYGREKVGEKRNYTEKQVGVKQWLMAMSPALRSHHLAL